jgi:hypothetical protein
MRVPISRLSGDMSQYLENVAQFRYFGTTITNQNLIQEEIKEETEFR